MAHEVMIRLYEENPDIQIVGFGYLKKEYQNMIINKLKKIRDGTQ